MNQRLILKIIAILIAQARGADQEAVFVVTVKKLQQTQILLTTSNSLRFNKLSPVNLAHLPNIKVIWRSMNINQSKRQTILTANRKYNKSKTTLVFPIN